MTRLLYDEDSTIRDFEGTVLHSVERDGATWIELDQTAFYPAGGGQAADRGLIADSVGSKSLGAAAAELVVRRRRSLRLVKGGVAWRTQSYRS